MSPLHDRMTIDSELMDYLRVFMMVWQKIDFIWGLFVTSYIPLFGFLHFYQGNLDGSFALLFVVAIAGFTYVNGSALRSHYEIATTMSREFRRLNRSLPDLNAVLARRSLDKKAHMVLFTHGFSFAGFLFMMGGRLGDGMCTGAGGWGCLFAMVFG